MKKRISERGQTLPLVAVALVVLLGSAGFAADVGYHQYQQRMQQTATDSAALAGASELTMGDWKAAAQQDAANDGFTDNTGGSACDTTLGRVCVEVYNPPQASDAFTGNTEAVEVDITVNHATFFEHIFGINYVPVTTKAVALLQPQPSNLCLYVLNGQANFNGQSNPGSGTVYAPNCGMAFNQAANFHASTVTAAAIDCAATCSNGTFLEATPDPTSPVSDPCSGVQNSSGVYFCANLANTPPSCSTTLTIPNVKVGDTVVLQPGCYNNLDVSKAASVTFGCGLYIITGTLNARTSSSGTPKNISQDCGTGGPSGVTFYVSGSGSMDFGNNNINLSAPTSGDYAIYSAGEQNMLVYQTPGDTNTVNMQSATCSTCNSYMDGMIYAPSATLNYNQYSNTNSFGQVFIVAGTLNANGGMNSILTGPGGQPSYTVMVPVLGE